MRFSSSVRGCRSAVVCSAFITFITACGDDVSSAPRRSVPIDSSDRTTTPGGGASGAGAGDGAGAGAGDTGSSATTSTIAHRHPGDVGISTDRAVVFAENFERANVAEVQAQFNSDSYILNRELMDLASDVPAKSAGRSSLSMTTQGDRLSTSLFKLLPSDYEELYTRYYIKYPAGGRWHHTGVWTGGYNPRIPWASPNAGELPAGDDRISVAFEPIDTVPGSYANPRLDLYMYWMKMHSGGDGKYWGNIAVNRKDIRVDDDQWMCIETHIKLNSDLSSAGGAELDVWKNDVLVQHFDDSAPRGFWVYGSFCADGTADSDTCTNYRPADAKSETANLQWRKNANLKLNYIWPLNDSINDTTLYIDDLVVATERIGCIAR